MLWRSPLFIIDEKRPRIVRKDRNPQGRFPLEAVRAGLKTSCRERDCAVTVSGADDIPQNVLEEDPLLRIRYAQAVTRMRGE